MFTVYSYILECDNEADLAEIIDDIFPDTDPTEKKKFIQAVQKRKKKRTSKNGTNQSNQVMYADEAHQDQPAGYYYNKKNVINNNESTTYEEISRNQKVSQEL